MSYLERRPFSWRSCWPPRPWRSGTWWPVFWASWRACCHPSWGLRAGPSPCPDAGALCRLVRAACPTASAPCSESQARISRRSAFSGVGSAGALHRLRTADAAGSAGDSSDDGCHRTGDTDYRTSSLQTRAVVVPHECLLWRHQKRRKKIKRKKSINLAFNPASNTQK